MKTDNLRAIPGERNPIQRLISKVHQISLLASVRVASSQPNYALLVIKLKNFISQAAIVLSLQVQSAAASESQKEACNLFAVIIHL